MELIRLPQWQASPRDGRESVFRPSLPGEIEFQDTMLAGTTNLTLEDWIRKCDIVKGDRDDCKKELLGLGADGCMAMPIDVHDVPATAGIENANTQNGNDIPNNQINGKATRHSVKFLANYRLLWDTYEEDNVDELSYVAPLFRVYLEFFFHLRMTQFYTIITFYSILLLALLDTRWPQPFPVTYIVISYMGILLKWLVHLALVVLFKGQLFPKNVSETVSVDPKHEAGLRHVRNVKKTDKRPVHIQPKYSMNWGRSARQVLLQSCREIGKAVQSFKERGISAPRESTMKSDAIRSISFCELLNVSLKFLVRHNKQLGGDQINFHNRRNTAKLLFILIGLPVYFVVSTYKLPGGLYLGYTQVCDLYGTDSAECKYQVWKFYLSGAYMVDVMRLHIFAASVLLSLIGFSFGSEIARTLVDSWIIRFSSLARVRPDLQYPSMNLVDGGDNGDDDDNFNDGGDGGGYTAGTTGTGTAGGGGGGGGAEEKDNNTARPNDGAVSETVNNNNDGHVGDEDVESVSPGGEESGDVENGMLTAFQQPQESTGSYTTNVLHRTAMGKKKDTRQQQQQQRSQGQIKGGKTTGVVLTVNETIPYIQRDAYEHYLFIREYMSIATDLWSPVVISFLFLTIFFGFTFIWLAITLAQYTTTADWIYYAIWVVNRTFLLVIYPILLLSNANSYLYVLQEQFLIAASEDFAVLGGRQRWLSYLTNVPAVWSIYGVWVTWERITGLLWAAITGLGVTAITVIVNGNSGSDDVN